MTTIQAIIMGLIQGLTEYLPVSSSGHLAIASALTGVDGESSMTFTIAVHVATVLSTIVVLGRQIWQIIAGTFSPLGPGTGLQRLNPSQQYLLNIVISMVPIGIVGVFFKDQVEAIFGSGLTIVGICLLVTALLLTFSYLARPRQRQSISPRLPHRRQPGPRRAPRSQPFGHHHSHRPHAWQQQGSHGTVLIPHGHTPHIG